MRIKYMSPIFLMAICATNDSTLLNRSILSVEGEVYSLYDSKLVLKMWNTAFPNEKVAETTEWETTSGFFLDKRKTFLKNYEKWPADVQRLLAISLTWPEVSQLKLFIPDTAVQQKLVEAIRNPALWPSDTAVLNYLKTAPDRRLLQLADMVLRTHESETARGTLRESAGSLTWFWHQAPAKPKSQSGTKESR